MTDDSNASNEPNLDNFYKTPQYCLAITRAHAEFLQYQDKPGGLVVAGTMTRLASHWADLLLRDAKRLNLGMLAFCLWHKGIVDASGLDGGMGERAWTAFRTLDQLWPKVEAELERLREAAISEATGQAAEAEIKAKADGVAMPTTKEIQRAIFVGGNVNGNVVQTLGDGNRVTVDRQKRRDFWELWGWLKRLWKWVH